MSLSSDEIIKREIVEKLGTRINSLKLRLFPESSIDDQKMFSDGGLTFGIDAVAYGSCDACWYIDEEWTDPYNNKKTDVKPIIAIEGTDALNRGSSGNAQLQRFHHALGAVKSGLIGVYYLRKGIDKIREDLFGMAYFASIYEKGTYLIVDDLIELKDLLLVIHDSKKARKVIDEKLKSMNTIFLTTFHQRYKTWEKFAEKRSTILKNDYLIKYSGRMRRNFTEASQRAGHIAVGEMLLTKYFFIGKKIFYLWPKMTREDLIYLDNHKQRDKEWQILRKEPNVQIITIDDLENIPNKIVNELNSIKDEPLVGENLRLFNRNVAILRAGLIKGSIKIKST